MMMNVSHSSNNNVEYLFYCPALLCASQDGTILERRITIGHDLAMQHCATALRNATKYVRRREQETVGKTTN